MRFFDQSEFDMFVCSLQGSILVDQWDSRVAKVGNKVFTLLTSWKNNKNIIFKCAEESFEILTSLKGISQAPYFAKRKWVSVTQDTELLEDELREYIKRSHALVAKGLTRKIKRELGID